MLRDIYHNAPGYLFQIESGIIIPILLDMHSCPLGHLFHFSGIYSNILGYLFQIESYVIVSTILDLLIIILWDIYSNPLGYVIQSSGL